MAVEELAAKAHGVDYLDEGPMLMPNVPLARAEAVCAAGVLELVVGELVVGVLLIAHYLVGLFAFPGRKENHFVATVLVVCAQRSLLFERS